MANTNEIAKPVGERTPRVRLTAEGSTRDSPPVATCFGRRRGHFPGGREDVLVAGQLRNMVGEMAAGQAPRPSQLLGVAADHSARRSGFVLAMGDRRVRRINACVGGMFCPGSPVSGAAVVGVLHPHVESAAASSSALFGDGLVGVELGVIVSRGRAADIFLVEQGGIRDGADAEGQA